MASRLVLGNGFVGSVFGSPVSRSQVDYTNAVVFEKLLKDTKPDVVINCAGFTGRPHIDQCEVERYETIKANIVLPATLYRVCASLGIKFVHMSSGCIYDGDNHGRGWSEADEPTPRSFYSITKTIADEVIGGYVIRLRMPFINALHPRDFLTKIRKYPKLINEHNSLTYLPDLVSAVQALIEKNAPEGIYNVVNTGSASHREIVEIFNQEGVKWNPQFITSTEFSSMVVAPRSNCILSNETIGRYFSMPYVHQRLREVARRMRMAA